MITSAGTTNGWRLAWLAAALLASGPTAAAPILSVDRTLIDWGNVSFGAPPVTQSFYISNTGNAPLALTGYGLIGSQRYALGGPCWTVYTLAPGASCRMDITLTVANQVQGAITARVEIDSNGGPTVQVQLRAFNTGASGPPSPALDLNQHGITGSWYEPATDGQGFEVEMFPDLTAPGTGITQVSWFTYDTAAGGADHQRWYTMSGPVVSGVAKASLTIYRNTGGNFNAGPVTVAQSVGTAMLGFDTCATGQLDYSFADGSGRTGSIPLTRLTQNVTCVATGTPLTDVDFALSGNWFDTATSGQGMSVEVNPVSSVLFFAWYTYAPSGASLGAAGQRWYTGQGTYTRGSRSMAFQLYETTGGAFDASNPASTTAIVGSGTLTFESCSNATLNFDFTGGSNSGKSGTIALGRIGPTPRGCVL